MECLSKNASNAFHWKRWVTVTDEPVSVEVTLVDHDHIDWKSWKLIAWTINPTPSPFVAQRSSTYFHGRRRNFGETRGGVGKVEYWSTIAAISLKRVKIEEKLLWRAYRKSPMLFRFLGRRHISTSGFAFTATKTAAIALYLPVQPSNWH